MKTGNLLIKNLGENVNLSMLVLVSSLLNPKLDLGKGLIGERARHDERRMSGGTSKVKKTSLGKNDNSSSSILEGELVYLGLDVHTLSDGHKSIHINLVIEVTNVSNNSVILHLLHGGSHENSLVSGGGDENISNIYNILKSGYSVSLHACLKSTDGVNLGNENYASTGTHGMGTSLTNISVSADNSLLSSHHNISGTHDSIGKGVLASVKIVELGLGYGVVYIDSREEKVSLLLHGVQTVNSGGGLLRDSHTATGDLVPLISLSSLKKTLDDGEDNLELSIISGGRIGKSSILKEKVLGLLSLMDKKSHISTIINNDIHTVTLAIILRPGYGIEGALPVLL
mmetsp:Transcript_21159/g.32158  ORF Transcript_21159/g.32158 Transcript_21159/m.32158 type:complete len:342 (-) Transcript_21159:337-1362(-)